MARELKPGDVVRTLGGSARVVSVGPAGSQPVHNLKVLGGDSYFAGGACALVHDASEFRPVYAPFDSTAHSAGLDRVRPLQKPRAESGLIVPFGT